MKNLFPVLLASVICASSSYAAGGGPAISDPQSILPQVDSFLGQADFSRAFQTGDGWSYAQKDCLGQSGDGPCDEMHSDVAVEVKGDAILTSSIDGRPTGTETFTRDEWLSNAGSAIRMRIASFNSASYAVVLEKMENSQLTVEVNGHAQVLETRRVSLNAKSPAGISIHEMIEVSKDLPGIAQVVHEDRVTSGLGAGVTALSLTSFHRN